MRSIFNGETRSGGSAGAGLPVLKMLADQEEGDMVGVTTQELMELVDTLGLSQVLAELEDICEAKSEDLRENGQDTKSPEYKASQHWEAAGRIIATAANRAVIQDLSS